MKNFTIEKDATYFGVRFQPGENPCFKNQVVKELVGKDADLKQFSNIFIKPFISGTKITYESKKNKDI